MVVTALSTLAKHGLVLDNPPAILPGVLRHQSLHSSLRVRSRRRSADDNVAKGKENKWFQRTSFSSPPSPAFHSHEIDFNNDSFRDGGTGQTWSEYPARRSMVKFRNRRSAKKSSPRSSQLRAHPSKLLQRVLAQQYSVARDQTSETSDKVTAIFYCWFFGWIYDVYNVVSNNGSEAAFWKWTLSCLLVTSASVLVIAMIGSILYVSLLAFTILLRASLNFVVALALFLMLTFGLISICSYTE